MRKRMGLLLMMGGVVLALIAAVTVMTFASNARKAAAQVKQVEVVVAKQEIPQGTSITAAMLDSKAFPAEFAPEKAVSSAKDADGRFAATHIVTGQIITQPVLSTTKQAGNLSLSIPKGKVAFGLPKWDLLSANGLIKPEDHVDILVTFKLKLRGQGAGGSEDERHTTQTTLQDIEVLEVIDGAAAAGAAGGGGPAVVLLLDNQQAVQLKLAIDSQKDDMAFIDLVLRSADEDHKPVETDGATEDSEIVHWKFRKPAQIR